MSHPNHHSYRESIPPTALGLPINSHLFQLQLKFMFFFLTFLDGVERIENAG